MNGEYVIEQTPSVEAGEHGPKPVISRPLMSARSVDLSPDIQPDFGRKTVVGRHALQSNALFSDQALTALLDRFPRQHLYAFHMGGDPCLIEENRLATQAHLSGVELLQAVRGGRLWLNLTRVDRADEGYRALITQLYEELGTLLPGFAPQASQGTLLISSPRALVYYHADGPASVLWHLRGRKRVWVYPPLDTRYMRRELLEDIFAGVRHEYLPYESAYDEAAQIYDLEPGQWIAWPQNAPHRVSNLDSLNVSLSTEHFTEASQRRFRLYLANRYLRTRIGVKTPSPQEDGLVASAKILTQRIARKLGLDPVQLRHHRAVLRVQPDAPGGVVPLETTAEPVAATA